MTISGGPSLTPRTVADIAARPATEENVSGVRDMWREVTSGELFSSALHLSPDKIRKASESARDVGNGLKGAWKAISDNVRSVLHLPVVEDHVSAESRDRIAKIATGVGYGVGFAGAGVLGVSGIYKLAHALHRHEKGQILDGLVDLTAGAAVAATVAAWAPGGLVLGSLAATVGVVRGGFNAVTGYRHGTTRPEIQGFLDAGNSSVALSRVLGRQMSALATATMILAPLAATVQMARGYWDLSAGLAEHSNEKKIQGLADVTAAVGLALTATAALAVPGVALVGIGSAVKIAYQYNKRAHRKLDHLMDRATPGLEKVVRRVDTVVDPLVGKARNLFEHVSGVKRGEETSPAGAGEKPRPCGVPVRA